MPGSSLLPGSSLGRAVVARTLTQIRRRRPPLLMEGKPGQPSLRSTLRDSLREVDDSTITLQGFLVKRAVSATLWKNWKRRWLVLRASPCGGGSLAWHVGPDPHGKPNGSLLLLEHSSLEHTNIGRPLCLTVRTGERVLVLQASSASELRGWWVAIGEAIKGEYEVPAALNTVRLQYSSSRGRGADGSGGAADVAFSTATLGTGDLRKAVLPPPGMPVEQWVAAGTTIFVQHTARLHAMLSAHCTPDSCPAMTAGPRCEYLWADDEAGGESLQENPPISSQRLCAAAHVGRLLAWAQLQLDELQLAGSGTAGSGGDAACGAAGDRDRRAYAYFLERVQLVYRRLARVFAHIYLEHAEHVSSLGVERLLNSTFKHFVYFGFEFELLEQGADLQPLEPVVRRLLAIDERRYGNGAGDEQRSAEREIAEFLGGETTG